MGSKRRHVVVSVRLPADIHKRALKKARREDLDFSKFIRRAIRKEMVNAGAASQ